MNTAETVKTVLDTNVLVSAALSNGKPYRILSMAEDEDITSVTSSAITDELQNVLSRDQLPFTDNQVNELVSKILSISRVVEPQTEIEYIEDDPDDDKILEAAVAGEADFIVSGDSHLLDIGEYNDIRILSPDQFLEKMSSE